MIAYKRPETYLMAPEAQPEVEQVVRSLNFVLATPYFWGLVSIYCDSCSQATDSLGKDSRGSWNPLALFPKIGLRTCGNCQAASDVPASLWAAQNVCNWHNVCSSPALVHGIQREAFISGDSQM